MVDRLLFAGRGRNCAKIKKTVKDLENVKHEQLKTKHLVLRKAGMEYTGTEIGKYKKNGEIFNAPQYQITKNAWENNIS